MTPARPLALFDFDGTLCAGNSFHLLIAHLARSRGRQALRIAGWALLRKVRLISSRRFKEGVLGALSGADEASLRALGQTLYLREIRPRLFREAVEELERLRQSGHRLVLVTGGFDFLVRPFCEEFVFDDCLPCRVEIGPAGCTGRVLGPEMLGPDKAPATSRHFEGTPVDWAGSVAYSDDLRDLPWLRLAGTRFWVNAARPRTAPADVVPLRWSGGLGRSG